MAVFQKGITEESNQANHEREQQEILQSVKIAPTNVHSEVIPGAEDY